MSKRRVYFYETYVIDDKTGKLFARRTTGSPVLVERL